MYQMFEGCKALETLDLKSWDVYNFQTCEKMFLNCSALKSINFDGGTWRVIPGDAQYHNAFDGCTSLVTLKPSFMTGYLRTPSIFKGCASLKELDLSSIGSAENVTYKLSNLKDKANIFEGCNELAAVTLNEKYPTAEFAGSSVPSKQTWTKIKNADGSGYTGAKLVLSASQLFLDFKTEYAGTWVTVDKIVLNSNGGVTEQQSIDGAKYMTLEYDPSDIVEPERVGYDFDDWYSEKEDGKGVKLAPGTIAQSWAYYAHWIPHTYTLIINGNGGTVPEGAEVNGGTVSRDRTTITYSNITYPQFVELNNGMFTMEGANQLTSFNTRANGKGNGYSVNDSVNKLTPTDKDTVTLFAQWTESDYVVTFDSQGGSAINKKYYNRNDKYGTLPTPEKTASTFLGWYTQAEGGTEVTGTTVVNGDKTLYAHWKDNPKVYFNPNGSGAQLDGSTDTQFKVYNVGQKLGVLPVPDWGTRTFKGWYEDAAAETEGTLATSNTSDTKSVTYDFTDAHIYGDPSWSWANDYSSAKATFTCTDERCKHKETVDATVTVTETTEKVKYTATAAFEGKTYTDTQEIDNEIGTRLVGYSLSLKGDIGVNFYMELSDSVVEHKDTAYMYFTIPGNTTTYQTVFVKDAESEIIDGRTYYKFPCKVAAKEITSQIKAQIHDGVKKGTEYKYSVKDYADYLIEHQDESKMFKDAVDLAKAMMTYGENAKWYFDKTETPPQKITDVTVPEYERTVYSDNLPEGVSFSGATLSLKSETTLSLYFYGDPNLNLSCTDKGVEYDIERSGKECVIRIRNIAAYELNRDFTVKINGKDAVKYNPLRYCYLSQTSSDEKLANTVKAIYRYWIEAKKYFDKINASAGGNE